MEMPKFEPNRDQKEWVATQAETGRLIRYIWTASSKVERHDYRFLLLLIKCGWCNGMVDEAILPWRNRLLSDYLGLQEADSHQLVRAMLAKWPSMRKSKVTHFLNTPTGIALYFRPLRPAATKYIEKNASTLAKVFESVASAKGEYVHKSFAILSGMARFRTPTGGRTSIINPVSPCLSCLDPKGRFPIMNKQTAKLLRCIDKVMDADGADALVALIGMNGVHDNHELDVYSQTADFSKITKRHKRIMPVGARVVGIKSEVVSDVKIAKETRVMRVEHNKLMNKFRKALLWRYRLEEAGYDALIPDWKEGMSLLVEAKTSSSGVGGRNQIRQAIGQLFDYRMTYFPNSTNKVRLAVLLPDEPPTDVLELLGSLHIYGLWFKRNKLTGTVDLI